MAKSTEKFFEEKKEWSKIKDNILACYIKPYLMKIKNTSKPIVYIDGFAGKGKFDDGTLGSPLIVSSIAEENGVSVEYIFIEKKYHKDLESNTSDLKKCTIIAGSYEDNIVNIIKNNRGKNLFVYIDPFGIKSINFSYLKELNSSLLYSAEFLMNLNSFGFIREGCRLLKDELNDVCCDEFDIIMDENEEFKSTNSIEHMNEIAGGDYWQDIIKLHREKKITGYEAERMFVVKYCDELQKSGKFKYVINVPIRLKAGIPPKYRMVFATNHIDGIILMNNDMCKRFDEILQIQNGGISTLFQENSENDLISEESITFDIKSLLSLDFIEYNNLLINYIKKYGIMKTSVISSCLKKMELNGIIEIKRIPEFTDKCKKSTFMIPSKDKNLFIRLKGDKDA